MKYRKPVTVEVEVDMKDMIRQYILNVGVPKTYVQAARLSNVNALLNTIQNIASGVNIDVKFEVD